MGRRSRLYERDICEENEAALRSKAKAFPRLKNKNSGAEENIGGKNETLKL